MLDVDDENVLKIIFKDSFPESWRENSDVAHYLRELSSYGLERICKEPEAVTEEKNAILEQTQDLVFHNYKTFIKTAECSKEIFEDFNLVEENLSAVSQQLPHFIEKCQQFSRKSQEIAASRRLNSLTLTKHPQLLEILEMPQLMDTCVRNSYYDEALELAAYVFHLEKKYSSIPIIVTIAKDVQDSMKLMLNQLIQQLRTNIQLPVCLKVIGYLRRMDVFSEEELRIKFLQTRDAWFQSILQNIPTNDAYQHLIKVIEVSRVHLFDIMTQYRAIFADDDPLLIGVRGNEFIKSAILHGWVMRKISQFLKILEKDLQKDIGGRIESLLGQCMYFGLSFSRVGADFRSLLVPLFEQTVLQKFNKTILKASNDFANAMQSYVFTVPPTMYVSSVLASTTAAQDKLHPPMSLLEFPPLAELCNNILVAFNELRLLMPVSAYKDTTSNISNCLRSATKVILDFYKAEENAFSASEKEFFMKFCTHYAHDLVPFLRRCLQALFPQQQLAQTLGLSLTDFNKLGKLGYLDISIILEPLLFIIPNPELELESDLKQEAHFIENVSPLTDEMPSTLPPKEENQTFDSPPSTINPILGDDSDHNSEGATINEIENADHSQDDSVQIMD